VSVAVEPSRSAVPVLPLVRFPLAETQTLAVASYAGWWLAT
jgi:hypothetical protein